MKKNPKFNIGDKVFHISPDSPQGVVLDIIYYFKSETFNYMISWGHDYNSTVWEEELVVERNVSNTPAGFSN